jgi:hypothetical protein
MNVAPPTEQGPAGQGAPRPGWRRLPRGLARRLRPRLPTRTKRASQPGAPAPPAPERRGEAPPEPEGPPPAGPEHEEPRPDPRPSAEAVPEPTPVAEPGPRAEPGSPAEPGPGAEGEAGQEPRRSGWRRAVQMVARPALGSLLVCLGLSVAMFWEMWQDPAHRLLGSGGGDGAIMMWFLRWTPAALGHGLNPLFSDYLNFPPGVNVMWNTSLLLPGLLLAPITLTWGPVVTFNVLCTVSLALSAWCATLAFRRYIRSNLAALIGGLAYGFSPYMLAQNRAHLQLTIAFLPPLLFLVADNILVRQRRPAWLSGAVLGVLAALQVLIGEEVFALAAVVLTVYVVLMMLLFPRHVLRKAPYAAIAFGTAAVAFVAIAGYPIWFQLFGPQHVTGDIQNSSNKYLTDLWNFITPTRAQALVPASATRITSHFTGNFAETNGYIGIPLILVVLFTAARWAWSKAVVRVAFLLTLATVVLSLGDHLHIRGRITNIALPWNSLQNLPLLESGLPNRFMLFAMLFCGLLLAFFIDQALRWRWVERVPAVLLVIAVMVALAPRLPLHAGRLQAPAFFTSAAVQRVPRGSVMLVAPYPGPGSAVPMTWQALAGMRYRMPGGYFVGPRADGKPRYGGPTNQLTARVVQVGLGWDPPNLVDPYRRLTYSYNLVQLKVRTVVVGPMRDKLRRANTIKMFTDLLGRPPSKEGGVDVWWDVQPQRLLDEAARSLR